MLCPNCGHRLEQKGFGYYQCTLTSMKYPHEIDPSLFNPKCLLMQKIP